MWAQIKNIFQRRAPTAIPPITRPDLQDQHIRTVSNTTNKMATNAPPKSTWIENRHSALQRGSRINLMQNPELRRAAEAEFRAPKITPIYPHTQSQNIPVHAPLFTTPIVRPLAMTPAKSHISLRSTPIEPPQRRNQHKIKIQTDGGVSFEPEQVDLQLLKIAIKHIQSTYLPPVWKQMLLRILDIVHYIEPHPIPSYITTEHISKVIARGIELSQEWTDKSTIERRVIENLRFNLRDIQIRYDALCHPDLLFDSKIRNNIEGHTKKTIQREGAISSHHELHTRSKTKINFAPTYTFIPKLRYDPLPQFNSGSAQAPKSILKMSPVQTKLCS